jgi:hypothetical protein
MSLSKAGWTKILGKNSQFGLAQPDGFTIHTKCLGQFGTHDLDGDLHSGPIVERLESGDAVIEKRLESQPT